MDYASLPPKEAIRRAKLRYMKKDAQKFDWKEVEDNMVTQWYAVSKIMSTILPPSFPWFTFKGIVEEIHKDPNYKKKDE